MIADTSIWIDFFLGKPGEDLDSFRLALSEGRVVMAPAVLSELLSSIELTDVVEKALIDLEFAKPKPDFWKECGKLRRRLAKIGYQTSLADCLVMQSCLEHRLPLLTRDQGIKKAGTKTDLMLL